MISEPFHPDLGASPPGHDTCGAKQVFEQAKCWDNYNRQLPAMSHRRCFTLTALPHSGFRC